MSLSSIIQPATTLNFNLLIPKIEAFTLAPKGINNECLGKMYPIFQYFSINNVHCSICSMLTSGINPNLFVFFWGGGGFSPGRFLHSNKKTFSPWYFLFGGNRPLASPPSGDRHH